MDSLRLAEDLVLFKVKINQRAHGKGKALESSWTSATESYLNPGSLLLTLL